ncbi:S1/P1 nuclease [Synoicihabitans lomoniglobus]|uniref:S1/P1 nuclease n=1 Tax=Synoicihabitans lomoniglobus TaxID=2909285 RepID=A0AAF0CPT9_9BACT|nr:S1/P1 nuclease [Opitutaceae bacterium LMO-M01]WED65830.1 S1/P1 nuclease [Opitutaceae bacterium LMO-M01]
MRVSIVLILVFLAVSPANAWGPVGHRVTGALAQPLLTPKTAEAVRAIIGSETLAEASTWPDEMRSDPAPFWQHTASPWHYVTVPEGKTYAEVGAPEEGDAYTALQQFARTLRDPSASLADKQLALRFTVHLVGDLHQPLHVGNGQDRGGNQVKVNFMREDTNLHSVWDSKLIERRKLSYSELAAFLARRITPELRQEWSTADPLIWMAESAEIRDTIYPEGATISWDYGYRSDPIVDQRLEQAGVRLAAYLNELFK